MALKAADDASGFDIREVVVGGRPGLLVAGLSDEDDVEWVAMVHSLTSVDLGYKKQNAVCALFIDVDGTIYAVTFNHGWRLVRDSRVDRGFGIDFAVRVLDDNEIRQITRWALSSRSRVDRNAVPGGQGLWSFGLREHAELVRELVGKARADLPVRLTHMRPKAYRRHPRLKLECRDGVKVPLSVEGDGLVADLREINRVLADYPVVEELRPLQWVRRVPVSDARHSELEKAVAELLVGGGTATGEVGISYPAHYFEGPDVSRYRGQVGAAVIDTDELTLDHFSQALRTSPTDRRLSALRSGHIDGYDEDGTSGSEQMNAVKWLAAEVDLPDGRHVLLDGEWFHLGTEYVRHVDRVVRQAFASAPPWTLPPWGATPPNAEGKVHEGDYNAHVAKIRPGQFLCLDKKLVKCRAHPRGFEACDLLGPDDALVHVKKTSSNTGSSPLSHLFAQGLVAAESFTERATWDRFRDLVAEQDRDRARRMGNRPGSVVFAIHRSDRPLTVDTLFTFARSALVSTWTTLTTYGIPVHVAVVR